MTPSQSPAHSSCVIRYRDNAPKMSSPKMSAIDSAVHYQAAVDAEGLTRHRLPQTERYLAVFSDPGGVKVRQCDSEQPHTPRRRELSLKKIEAELLDQRP